VSLIAMALLQLAACGAPPVVSDPMAELKTVPNSPRRQIVAMETLDARLDAEIDAGIDAEIDTVIDEEAYLETLHRMIWVPGYTVEVREAALDRLEQRDLPGLKRTIRNQIARLAAWRWLTRLCEIIADREWVDLTPGLVSSWARPMANISDERDRPEYQALARLYGADRVTDVVFDLMVETPDEWREAFRTRCWMLVQRLGRRDRLIELLRDGNFDPTDGMMVDLQRGADELGIVPHNREEILWIRAICKPEHAEYWSQAVEATRRLSPSRRADLEMRDLAVVVSAARHDPEMLGQDRAELMRRLEARLAGRRHYTTGSRNDPPAHRSSQRLRDVAKELTWGDLASMLTALQALEVPQVVDHLFDYAERDRLDETTEYGGVIDLDEKGRFEVLEFPPRIRRHDQRFNAPQAMFDAGYTALFHFHYHVQRFRNEEYAGPGYGDRDYAANTRANCLVMTYIAEGRLNVDYYRHDNVVVDLGVIEQR
jgi:hypothetical protein